jgi:3-deoxy-D-manno-octulosonic acid kinase
LAPGRGTTLFIDAPFGPGALRRYLRGGWPARISRDRYVFTGYRRTRPLREFELLRDMEQLGLPAPRPVAACCERSGLLYRGALLTHVIPGVEPLADCLRAGLSSEQWRAIGACIARFHAAGVRHADLNARNILLRQPDGAVFLVDFDRGRYTPGRAVDGRRNLARLLRSLKKLWPRESVAGIKDRWNCLLEGYRV